MLWLLLLPLGAVAEDHCYARNSSEHYNLFGAKTLYDEVRNPDPRPQNISNCEAVTAWGMIRHGARYPHIEELELQETLAKLRDVILRNHEAQPQSVQLCPEDLELLRDWKYDVAAENLDLITSSGFSEAFLLAERLRLQFPSLFDAPYSEDRFKIRVTSKLRSWQSAQFFTKGLFGSELNFSKEFVDDLYNTHECDRWNLSKTSEPTQKEIQLFREGPFMRQLISSVSKRLGFQQDLTYKDVFEMYDTCRFDMSMHPEEPNSAWCAVFTNDELKLMEYDEDLDFYYKIGYGNPFSAMLGCPQVADLIHTLHNRTVGNRSKGPNLVLYFSHSLTLRTVLVRLGIARDPAPLTADGYPRSGQRKWRASLISPFTTNLFAVLYRCGEEFKVMFYLNEYKVDYEGCDDGLCNWTYIYDKFSPIVNAPSKCDYDFCEISAAPRLHPAFLPLLFLLTAFFL